MQLDRGGQVSGYAMQVLLERLTNLDSTEVIAHEFTDIMVEASASQMRSRLIRQSSHVPPYCQTHKVYTVTVMRMLYWF
jgi:hypothetical protein